ncbi:MAG: hypothetical protein II461_05705 [Treponema sp.]|nr:hypothetical protein [Treponema sp.]
MKVYYQLYDPKNPTDKMRWPYRFGKVKHPSEKRISKVRGKKLADFNVLYAYFTIPFRIPSIFVLPPFLHTVIWYFFLPQYFRKIKLTRTPIKHVDHALDEKVPFRPDYVGKYMDFINIWIRPLSMLMHRFGTIQGAPLCAEWLRYLTLVYHEAMRIYKVSMTTTYRPKTDSKKMKALYAADPHYMCVPSLHIIIVCLTFSFYRMIFEREEFTEEEKAMWNKELFDCASGIGETVLYVKQHSVNCIPAALYMITRIVPELFTPEIAIEFISALFKNKTDISETERKKIQAHIIFTYERFLLEGAIEEDWMDPVTRWLDSYQSHVPFYADLENPEDKDRKQTENA